MRALLCDRCGNGGSGGSGGSGGGDGGGTDDDDDGDSEPLEPHAQVMDPEHATCIDNNVLSNNTHMISDGFWGPEATPNEVAGAELASEEEERTKDPPHFFEFVTAGMQEEDGLEKVGVRGARR
jgi:hypothetical protein